MLWLIPADTHEQRIGIMGSSQAFSTHRRPTTSVSAARVSPRPPVMLIGVSLAETAETAEMAAAVRGDPMTPDRDRH
jgi:hypothetical protein